jgi:hypothetical protein
MLPTPVLCSMCGAQRLQSYRHRSAHLEVIGGPPVETNDMAPYKHWQVVCAACGKITLAHSSGPTCHPIESRHRQTRTRSDALGLVPYWILVGEIGQMNHCPSEGGCACRGRRYPAPIIGHKISAAAIFSVSPWLGVATEPVGSVFFNGDPHQLAARSYACLMKQLLNNCLDGAFRDLQLPCDLLIGETVENS